MTMYAERQFVEVLTQELVARFGLRAGGRLVDRVRALSAAGALTAQVERDIRGGSAKPTPPAAGSQESQFDLGVDDKRS
jgi:hypothetical protein